MSNDCFYGRHPFLLFIMFPKSAEPGSSGSLMFGFGDVGRDSQRSSGFCEP